MTLPYVIAGAAALTIAILFYLSIRSTLRAIRVIRENENKELVLAEPLVIPAGTRLEFYRQSHPDEIMFRAPVMDGFGVLFINKKWIEQGIDDDAYVSYNADDLTHEGGTH